MRGCLSLIVWTPVSLMTAGGLLGHQLYDNYPGAQKPSPFLTGAELVALAVFGMFWLAGIALIVALGWLRRAAREDMGRASVTIACVWALLVGWLTVGIKPLLFAEPARVWDARLWTWSVSSPVEMVFLPSFAVLLWSAGLVAMLFAARSIWRWLPAQ